MPPTNRRPRPVFLRASVWWVYLVLFAIAIPWYWPSQSTATMLGIPLWAAVSIMASALISLYTAWLLLKHWPEDSPDDLP